ncbi:MAG: hypothetical protein V4726_08260 [Verrucomicrobiota bacterium]
MDSTTLNAYGHGASLFRAMLLMPKMLKPIHRRIAQFSQSPQKIALPRVVRADDDGHRAQAALGVEEGAVVLEVNLSEKRHRGSGSAG